jgi:hypothetical protein
MARQIGRTLLDQALRDDRLKLGDDRRQAA